jgi:hypothetical protein
MGVDRFIEIITGNPGVFLHYPYPYPSKPLPFNKGRGFMCTGVRVPKGMAGMRYLQGYGARA